MDDGSGGATALLGMEGFVVLAMSEHESVNAGRKREHL
jgi:hypothetical protein